MVSGTPKAKATVVSSVDYFPECDYFAQNLDRNPVDKWAADQPYSAETVMLTNQEQFDAYMDRVYVRNLEASMLEDGTLLEYVTYESKSKYVPPFVPEKASLISVQRVVWLASSGTAAVLSVVFWVILTVS